MIRGLYTSALGMTTQMKRMDVITNNIANSDTNGFKRDISVTQSFSAELMKRLNDPGQAAFAKDVPVGNVSQGLFVNNMFTDFASGVIRKTDAPLDLAVMGSGYVAVSVTDANGNVTEKYTRDGAFSISADGNLITKEGNLVMGEKGVISFNANGDIIIDDTGAIYVSGQFIDKIKMVDFENYDSLRKFGDNMYDITDETVLTDFKGTVSQGFIEGSNINVVKEMVDMITVSRVYEANQKMISMFDTTLEQAASRIGNKV